MADDSIRERVLKAAVEQLGQHGLRGLSQPQVAKLAGVRQSHLTYYFPKRSDLLSAVAAHFIEAVSAEIVRVMESQATEDPVERLTRYVASLVKDRPRARILIGLLMAGEEDETLRKELVETVLASRALLSSALGLKEFPDMAMLEATVYGLGVQHLLLAGRQSDDATDTLVKRLAKTTAAKAKPPKKTRK